MHAGQPFNGWDFCGCLILPFLNRRDDRRRDDRDRRRSRSRSRDRWACGQQHVELEVETMLQFASVLVPCGSVCYAAQACAGCMKPSHAPLHCSLLQV